MVREYTNKLLEAIEEGMITHEAVVDMAMKYMSEDDVKDMCQKNEVQFLEDLEEEDEVEDEDLTQYYVYGDYGYQTETLLYETTLYSEAKMFFSGYVRDGDLGGHNEVELGYFAEDGEWITMNLAQKQDDLYSDLD